METDFQDIQKLWQGKRIANFDFDSMLNNLRSNERKQKREQILVVALTLITTTLLFLIMPWQENMMVLTGICLIVLAMGWVVWLTFRSNITSTDKSIGLSHRQYLEKQLERLQRRYRIAEKYMYFYGLALIGAVNVVYFVLLNNLANEYRLAIHLGVSLVVLLVVHISIRLRLQAYQKNLKPLIEELQTILGYTPPK